MWIWYHNSPDLSLKFAWFLMLWWIPFVLIRVICCWIKASHGDVAYICKYSWKLSAWRERLSKTVGVLLTELEDLSLVPEENYDLVMVWFITAIRKYIQFNFSRLLHLAALLITVEGERRHSAMLARSILSVEPALETFLQPPRRHLMHLWRSSAASSTTPSESIL